MTKSGIKLFCPKIIKLDGILLDIGTAALENTGTTVLLKPMVKNPNPQLVLMGKQAKLLRAKNSLLSNILQYLLKEFETDLTPEVKVQADTQTSLEEIYLCLLLGLWHLTENKVEEVNNLYPYIEKGIGKYKLDPQIMSTGFYGGMRIDQDPQSQNGLRIALPKDFQWLLVDEKFISPSIFLPQNQKTNTVCERKRLASFLHGALYQNIEHIQFGLTGKKSMLEAGHPIGFGAVPGTNLFYAIFKNRTDLDQFTAKNLLDIAEKLPVSTKISNLSSEGVRLL